MRKKLVDLYKELESLEHETEDRAIMQERISYGRFDVHGWELEDGDVVILGTSKTGHHTMTMKGTTSNE